MPPPLPNPIRRLTDFSLFIHPRRYSISATFLTPVGSTVQQHVRRIKQILLQDLSSPVAYIHLHLNGMSKLGIKYFLQRQIAMLGQKYKETNMKQWHLPHAYILRPGPECKDRLELSTFLKRKYQRRDRLKPVTLSPRVHTSARTRMQRDRLEPVVPSPRVDPNAGTRMQRDRLDYIPRRQTLLPPQ